MTLLADSAARVDCSAAIAVARGRRVGVGGVLGGALAGARRGGLRLAWRGRSAGAAEAAKAAALRFAARGRGVGSVSRVVKAEWRASVLGRALFCGSLLDGRRIKIAARAVGLPVGAPGRAAGPGQSAAETRLDMPGLWSGFALPAGFVGKKVAALALARGEAAEVDGNRLLIGGRVLIDAYGANVVVTEEGAADAVWALAMEAAAMIGGAALAGGAVRDAWAGGWRNESAAYVRKVARHVYVQADTDRRAALLADLRFSELRV